ncbi:hypothetical protein EC567_26355 [Vibrio parahaemolyticus]|nr:hypothetical protein [Vibrio parahaemolyticus]EGR1156401.1 hypothetical protein [Vibrio parahaemolyticus]KON58619.1 hypothetical protein ACX11_11275 [Vibrio parahaemolyticus]
MLSESLEQILFFVFCFLFFVFFEMSDNKNISCYLLCFILLIFKDKCFWLVFGKEENTVPIVGFDFLFVSNYMMKNKKL